MSLARTRGDQREARAARGKVERDGWSAGAATVGRSPVRGRWHARALPERKRGIERSEREFPAGKLVEALADA